MMVQKDTAESGMVRDDTLTPKTGLSPKETGNSTPIKDVSLPPLVISEKMREHYFNGMGRRLIATLSRTPWAYSHLNFPVPSPGEDLSLPIKHLYIIGNHPLVLDDIYETHIWPAVREMLERTKFNCSTVNVITVLTDFEGKRKMVLTIMITAEWTEENVEKGQEVVDGVKKVCVEFGVGDVECEIMEGSMVYL